MNRSAKTKNTCKTHLILQNRQRHWRLWLYARSTNAGCTGVGRQTKAVSGRILHSNTVHTFKIIDSPNCRCGNGNQTTEHILLECAILQEDRERLVAEVAKTDDWPISRDMLIKKHYKAFAKFTKIWIKLKKLTHETE